MGNNDVALVGKLQLVQPHAFVCGTVAVPLDWGDHHLLIQDCTSDMTVLHDRSSNRLYKRLPTDTDLNRPILTESVGPVGPHVENTREPFSQSIAWGGSYLPKLMAKKGEALAVTGLAQYGDSVDVIAPSAILKEIFKTPYSSSPLSLTVHRVGRTLILNSGLETDAESRRNGPCNTIDTALFSKFVNHSLQSAHVLDCEKTKETSGWEGPAQQVGVIEKDLAAATPPPVLSSTLETSESEETLRQHSQAEKRFTLKGGVDPQMRMHKGQARQQPPGHQKKRKEGGGKVRDVGSHLAEESEDASEDNVEKQKLEGFLRIVFWQFQHLRMLLGTDLLLFSNGQHGAVSLHLLEVEREVTPLQWLDVWLDNIMASVPELAVCYHRGGVVQGYELLKTDDIFLHKGLAGDGSPNFSPGLVQKNASSILQFLQENCTRDPGTYWLRKGAGDDKMQLFDLGSGTSTEGEHSQGLPPPAVATQSRYLLPLAMLLFRLADQLSRSKDMWNLQKCAAFFGHSLTFLDMEEHHGLRAVAHEQVARVFLSWHNEFGSPTKSCQLKAATAREGVPGNATEVLSLPAPPKHGLREADKDRMGDEVAPLSPHAAPGHGTAGMDAELIPQEPVKATPLGLADSAEGSVGTGSDTGSLEPSSSSHTSPVSSVARSGDAKHSESNASRGMAGETQGALVCVPATEDSGGRLRAADGAHIAETGGSGDVAPRAASTVGDRKIFPPENAVSARLEAVRHTSEAIHSLRKQRWKLEETVGTHRGHGSGAAGPELVAPCVCGEEECIPVGHQIGSVEVRVLSESRIQGLIAFLGDAYLSLAQACKEKGEVGRALRAAELACLVCGSMPSSLAKNANVAVRTTTGGSPPEAFREPEFWGRLWETVGDLYVQFQKFIGESDVIEESSRCQELRISDAVVREVKRMRKKYVRVCPTTCSGCSTTGCSCLSDRASSGVGASSSARKVEHPTKKGGGGRSGIDRNHPSKVFKGGSGEEVRPRGSSGESESGSASSCRTKAVRTKVGNRTTSGKKESRSQQRDTPRVDAAGGSFAERSGDAHSEGNLLGGEVRSSSGNEDTDENPAAAAAAALESPWEPLAATHGDGNLLCFGRPLTADWEVNYKAAAEYYGAAASAFADAEAEESQKEPSGWEGATRKKGWAHNELGRRLLAARRIVDAEGAFETAQDAFREVGDVTNVVLVDCNMGHGRRSAAEGLVSRLAGMEGGGSGGLRREVVDSALFLYLEALRHYTAARNELLREGESVLKTRGAFWNEVHTQFAHTYLRLGMLMAQEEVQNASAERNGMQPPTGHRKGKGSLQVDLTAMEAMTKALILYDSLGPNRVQEAAYAHLQIACLNRDNALSELQRLSGGVRKGERRSQKVSRGTGSNNYGEGGRAQGSRAAMNKYGALAEIHWQKALEVYRPEAHPDVYVSIVVERTNLGLASCSHSRYTQVLEGGVTHILHGVPVWSTETQTVGGNTDEVARGKAPSQESLDKMVGRLQFVLKELLTAALSVDEEEAEASRAMHSCRKREKLRSMYKVALSGANVQNLAKIHEMWSSS